MKWFVATFLVLQLPAAACLWDRDTLREEAKGKLDTVKAITGWFDRYPPRSYEMRLERVSKELESDPSLLNHYDDAGVACNRLGRYDEAIAWMERKKAVLDKLPASEVTMDRYRYLANLGSFLGNRWATRPAADRNEDPADLIAATKCIEDAIRLNPDAHFGREKYQLKLFEWLSSGFDAGPAVGFPKFLDLWGLEIKSAREAGGLAETGDEDAEVGMVGLIHLGSAWESIDVFDGLGAVVQTDGASSIAYLVELRLKELETAGHASLHPSPDVRRSRHGGFVQAPRAIDEWYAKARQAAKDREASWLAYQSSRFELGMHPDTHPDFWENWDEPGFPRMPWNPIEAAGPEGVALGAAAALIGGVIVLYVCLAWVARRKKKRALVKA